MSKIRQLAIAIMESVPSLNKLKNEAWYAEEDRIVALIEEHLNIKDDTYTSLIGEKNEETSGG